MGTTYRLQYEQKDNEPTEEHLKNAQPFNSLAEVIEATSHPAYKTDPHYQKSVQRCLELTSPEVLKAETGNSEAPQHHPRQGEYAEQVAEWTRRAMGDPRYKTSPLYREEVRKKLAGLHAGDEGSGLSIAPGNTNRVTITGEEGSGVSMQGLGCFRVTFEPELTGPDKPEPKPKAEPKKDNSIDIGAQGFGRPDKQ